MGKCLRSNISLEDGVALEIHCTTLFCSLLRPTTRCIKRPHPPSPTSPTGALNDKQFGLRSLSDCPGVSARIVGISAVVFTGGEICGVGVGTWRGWGGLGWGGENVSAWECGSGCMSGRECCVCGKVSFKTCAVSQINGAPRPLSSEHLLQGFSLLNPRVIDRAEQMFFITSVRSQPAFSGHSPCRKEQG